MLISFLSTYVHLVKLNKEIPSNVFFLNGAHTNFKLIYVMIYEQEKEEYRVKNRAG